MRGHEGLLVRSAQAVCSIASLFDAQISVSIVAPIYWAVRSKRVSPKTVANVNAAYARTYTTTTDILSRRRKVWTLPWKDSSRVELYGHYQQTGANNTRIWPAAKRVQIFGCRQETATFLEAEKPGWVLVDAILLCVHHTPHFAAYASAVPESKLPNGQTDSQIHAQTQPRHEMLLQSELAKDQNNQKLLSEQKRSLTGHNRIALYALSRGSRRTNRIVNNPTPTILKVPQLAFFKEKIGKSCFRQNLEDFMGNNHICRSFTA